MKGSTYYKFFIVFSIVIQLVGMSIFSYSDCSFLTTASVNIWDAIYQGRITEYFLLTAENARGSIVLGNPCGILYLLPWAIWNLPIWLTHIDINVPVNTPLCIFWSKLFLITCSFITANYSKKITSLFVDNKVSILCYVYILGTGSLFISIAYAGQDEIVYICAFMTALYYFFIEKYKKSIPLMILSVLLCPYMFIPVCIAIVTKFKKISYAIYIGLAAILPDKIVSWVCGINNIEEYINEGYAFYGRYNYLTFLDWFFNRTRLQSGTGSIQIFSCILVLLLGYCFIKQFKSKRDENIFVINAVSFFLVFLITIVAWSHAYRFFIGIPFLVISVFISGTIHKDLSFGLLLLVIFDFLRSLICASNDYIFQLSVNIISKNFIHSNYSLFTFIKEFLNIDVFFDPLCSITVGVYFLLLYYITKSNRFTILYNIRIGLCNILSMLVPAGLLCVYVFIVLFCAASNLQTSNSSVRVNHTASFVQHYIPKTNKIDRIYVRQDNKFNSPDDQLIVDIYDNLSEKLLITKKISIPTSEFIKIRLKDINVTPNNVYEFRFYGISSNKKDIKLFLNSDHDLRIRNGADKDSRLSNKAESEGVISKIIEKPF